MLLLTCPLLSFSCAADQAGVFISRSSGMLYQVGASGMALCVWAVTSQTVERCLTVVCITKCSRAAVPSLLSRLCDPLMQASRAALWAMPIMQVGVVPSAAVAWLLHGSDMANCLLGGWWATCAGGLLGVHAYCKADCLLAVCRQYQLA